MQSIYAYLLTVLSVAIISSIATHICGDNQAIVNVIKTIGAIIMTITIISPLVSFRIDSLRYYIKNTDSEAAGIVSEAKVESENEMRSIIKEHVQTYVINKAEAHNADIDVTVDAFKQDTLIPESITIEGEVSPYIKEILVKIISEDLGIPEDRQIWK